MFKYTFIYFQFQEFFKETAFDSHFHLKILQLSCMNFHIIFE